MRVLNERPPEWIMDGCMSQFRVDVNHTLWTYGDTIFNPGAFHISDSLLAHEALHSVQQREYEGGKDAWWKRYLTDAEFRFQQELQAHGIEYAALKKDVKDRNQQARALTQIAQRLSGPLYQIAMPYSECMKAIREIATAARL